MCVDNSSHRMLLMNMLLGVEKSACEIMLGKEGDLTSTCVACDVCRLLP